MIKANLVLPASDAATIKARQCAAQPSKVRIWKLVSIAPKTSGNKTCTSSLTTNGSAFPMSTTANTAKRNCVVRVRAMAQNRDRTELAMPPTSNHISLNVGIIRRARAMRVRRSSRATCRMRVSEVSIPRGRRIHSDTTPGNTMKTPSQTLPQFRKNTSPSPTMRKDSSTTNKRVKTCSQISYGIFASLSSGSTPVCSPIVIPFKNTTKFIAASNLRLVTIFWNSGWLLWYSPRAARSCKVVT
mmetsp:Transcript_20911/g.45969  ORF Transcript_20911/g.45969 Transcript_20911/m.45969 type:complete len:243 (-) Transcript_20911:504-1232(-)